MSDYIDRAAAINEIEGTTWYHISYQKNLVEGAACEADALYKATDIYNVIKSAPAADVQEIKHGKWIKMYNNPDDGNYYCSECHNGYRCRDWKRNTNRPRLALLPKLRRKNGRR